ncbi:MAG: nucleoside hydrolase-like domain-containing protein [Limisphaerales bacterium]
MFPAGCRARSALATLPASCLAALWLGTAMVCAIPPTATGPRPASAKDRHRVLVSTDVGGTDPDDFQSLVHLLVYADELAIEGIVSSPYGEGRAKDILDVIDRYEVDFANLRARSARYPTPDALRSITKQGETEVAPYSGVRGGTEGSQWIAACARRVDPHPLHVLVWGGIEDLAQALHDAPDILPRLRVHSIGGPNKKWSANAYQYIATHHPTLWIIESNATYRGWFVGGDQRGEWGNQEFVARHIAGHGALGDFFAARLGTLKMGDTPSVAWLLQGTPANPANPASPGWGGQFVRAWDRPSYRFRRFTTRDDRMEVFGVLELALPTGANAPPNPVARLIVENLSIPGDPDGNDSMRFRFCPKEAKAYSFTIRGNIPSLDGRVGGITAVPPSPELANRPSAMFPNWWTDDPSPDLAEGPHHGARTVSRWREDFLRDFAARMDRCQPLRK